MLKLEPKASSACWLTSSTLELGSPALGFQSGRIDSGAFGGDEVMLSARLSVTRDSKCSRQ